MANHGNNWTFTPLELLTAWHSIIGRELLPQPLDVRTATTGRDEYIDEYNHAATVFADHLDGDLYGVLTTLALPRIRIHVNGYSGRQQSPSHEMRIHAAIGERFGAVLVQEPDDDGSGGGGAIHVDRLPVVAVARRVVEALPPTPAGRVDTVQTAVDNLQQAEQSAMPTSWLESPAPARRRGPDLRTLMSRPRTATAHIIVSPGPDLEDEDPDARHCHVIDITDDGRYLARLHGDSLRLDPVDATALTNHLARLLAQADTDYHHLFR